MNATITKNDAIELRLLLEKLEREAQTKHSKESDDDRAIEVIRRVLASRVEERRWH